MESNTCFQRENSIRSNSDNDACMQSKDHLFDMLVGDPVESNYLRDHKETIHTVCTVGVAKYPLSS